MSAAKKRGEHYTVKEPTIPGGYVCLHCHLGGDIRDIRSKLCVPHSPSSSPAHVTPSPLEAPPKPAHVIPSPPEAPAHVTPAPPEALAIDGEMMSAQEQARILQELQQEEDSLTEMILLQQLEMEQAMLESLLLHQRAEGLAAKLEDKMRVPSQAENKLQSQALPTSEPTKEKEANPGTLLAPLDLGPPPAPHPGTLANLPYGVFACNQHNHA